MSKYCDESRSYGCNSSLSFCFSFGKIARGWQEGELFIC